MRIRYLFCCLMLLLKLSNNVFAQHKTATDTILLGAIIENNKDTIPMVFLNDVMIIDRLPLKWVKQQARLDRLRYNVITTYPYAVIAAGVLKDVNTNLEMIHDEKAKKAYMKSVERELKAKFKGQLENLTISQGQVLVKLIDRQTGRNCYSIIKEVKGGFNAVIYQSIALIFSNNLRHDYDPQGDDKDIETIVKELETTNYYQYQYYKQQQMRQAHSN